LGDGTDPSRTSPIEDQRAEILRLIARLQANTGLLSDGDAAIVREQLEMASDAKAHGRSSSARPEATSTEPSVEPRGPRSRLEKRRRDLEEIKRLRARLEAEPPKAEPPKAEPVKSTADVTLKAIEGRLARMEARIFGKGDSAPAPPALPPPEEVPGQTFGGLIQGDILSDMLQLVSGNAMSGVFSVKNGETAINLFCESGKICHAEGQGLSGEGAVFAAFAFTEGTYSFKQTNELPKERTITANTQFLILEALRKIDESHAG
jgi:hypothetical protein